MLALVCVFCVGMMSCAASLAAPNDVWYDAMGVFFMWPNVIRCLRY